MFTLREHDEILNKKNADPHWRGKSAPTRRCMRSTRMVRADNYVAIYGIICDKVVGNIVNISDKIQFYIILNRVEWLLVISILLYLYKKKHGNETVYQVRGDKRNYGIS